GFHFGGIQDYITHPADRQVTVIGATEERIPKIMVGHSLKEDPYYEGELDRSSAPAVLKIEGKPSLYIMENSFTAFDDKPLTLNIEGNDHSFYGDLLIKNGQVYIPQSYAAKDKPRSMIDGVYVHNSAYYLDSSEPSGLRAERSGDIAVYFNDQEHEGNYISLGRKLHIGGKNFMVALSEEGRGKLSKTFNYEFKETSYVQRTDEEKDGSFSAVRLIVRLAGETTGGDSVPGKVIIDPEERKIMSSGTVDLINGPNRIKYNMVNGEQQYTYSYHGCNANSCAELNYDLVDGGTINVVQERNTVSMASGSESVPLEFGNSGDLGTKNLDLQKDHVYVLAYRGGEAAQQLFGKEKEEFDWGHVGMLYNKDGNWWVAEATGARTAINPLRGSLFQRDPDNTEDVAGLYGIWEVMDDNDVPVQSTQAIQAAEKMAGAKYDLNILTRDALSCVEVVCNALEAATDGDFSTRVMFRDVEHLDVPFSAVVKSIYGGVYGTPRAVIGSPNLKPLYVVLPEESPPDELKQGREEEEPEEVAAR
ncbi:MAG: hypothetical protein AABX37_02615, partial [Nanoarchaeota archaeon]